MSEFIANQDCTLSIITPGVSGVITVLSVPSTVMKAEGKGVYKKEIEFSVANVVAVAPAPPCGSVTPGTVTSAKILATAIAVTTEGDAVMRLGDKVTGVTTTGATNPGSPPISCTITFDVEITDAGQNKVKAV